MQLFNFLVDKKNTFGSFVFTLNKEVQQGKLILSFNVLGLEITQYAFIIFFFNFSFLDKTCKHNKSLEFSTEKVPCKLVGSWLFYWQNKQNVFRETIMISNLHTATCMKAKFPMSIF